MSTKSKKKASASTNGKGSPLLTALNVLNSVRTGTVYKGPDEQKKRKKMTFGSKTFNMEPYFRRLVHDQTKVYNKGASLEKGALSCLNRLATTVHDCILDSACNTILSSKKKDKGNTLSARAIKCGFACNVQEPIATPLQNYVTRAITNFNASKVWQEDASEGPRGKSVRAGITLSVSRVSHRMRARTRGGVSNLGGDAAVAMTAGIEFIFTLIINKAIGVAHACDRSSLSIVHIADAIKNSSGLKLEHLFENVVIQDAGIQNSERPTRHLLPKPPVKKEEKELTSKEKKERAGLYEQGLKLTSKERKERGMKLGEDRKGLVSKKRKTRKREPSSHSSSSSDQSSEEEKSSRKRRRPSAVAKKSGKRAKK
jgi:hypothetical protein